MTDVFIYIAIGALITGLLVGRDWVENPFGYVVAVTFWPFLAITVAASMLRDSVIKADKNKDCPY
jgi:hypothetical protein